MNNLINNNLLLNDVNVRRQRTYRLRESHLWDDSFTDDEIWQRFRFWRDSIRYIINVLYDDLIRPTNRNHTLSVETQVLAALRFFASGSFEQVIGDVIGIDKSTMSRVITGFCAALNHWAQEFIKFPFNNDEKNASKEGFFKMGGFPNVIGCADGTHIRLHRVPKETENDFVSRKRYLSINVQFIVDHTYKFIDVVAEWPGSTHDSFIFSQSEVKAYLQRNHTTLEKGILLGDSAYGLTNYLMTPYENPVTPEQRRFNSAQKSTRSSIERAIGQFKRRFYCMHRGVRVSPEKACMMIGTCAILHNIAIMRNEEPFDDDLDEEFECDDPAQPLVGNVLVRGQMMRNHITDTFFGQF